MKSALAARQVRAAMCGWILIAAIRGKLRKRSPVTKTLHGGRTSVSVDAGSAPRAIDGRAPDVFRAGGWVSMASYRDDDEVDFVIVGTGAGGGTLACKLAEY